MPPTLSPVDFALGNQRYRAAPSSASFRDLDRQARDMKTIWRRNLIQVRQLLDLAIFPREPRKVRRPNITAIAGALVIGNHTGKRPVDRIGVDSDHLDALLHEPERSVAAQAGLSEVLFRSNAFVGASAEQHDVERLQPISNSLQRRGEFCHGDLRSWF